MTLFGQRRIYLDYASATPVDPVAARAVAKASLLFGNPGSIHSEGADALGLLNESRDRLARTFGVKGRELVFTSGGTEANNLAVLGVARKRLLLNETLAGTHWIVSAIEHPSVLACFGEIERLGGEITFIDSDDKGLIRPETLSRALRRETVFVSIGWANSETGIVQPIAEIARAIDAHEKAHKTVVLFHTDAGQAPLYLPSTIHSLRVDLVSLDSAKLYGPRGIGVLYLSGRVELAPVLFGGSQERGLRPGTENLALAVGFAEALEHVIKIRAQESKRVGELRDTLAEILIKEVQGLVVNGDLSRALPHMLNISIPGIQSEYITLSLDQQGVAISTKSACREGEERKSHVVESMTSEADSWRSETALRFSLGRETTQSDIVRAADLLIELMHKPGIVGTAKRR